MPLSTNASTSHFANPFTSSTRHIPHEDILVAPQHLPPNPEDEDDVVPDQHAAFGITRAMATREGRERAWRDFGTLGGLVRGDAIVEGQVSGGTGGQVGRGTRI